MGTSFVWLPGIGMFVTASPCSPFCHLHTNFHAVTVKWTTVKSASLAGRRDTA